MTGGAAATGAAATDGNRSCYKIKCPALQFHVSGYTEESAPPLDASGQRPPRARMGGNMHLFLHRVKLFGARRHGARYAVAPEASRPDVRLPLSISRWR